MKKIIFVLAFISLNATLSFGQNTNSSTTTSARPRTSSSPAPKTATQKSTDIEQPKTTTTVPKTEAKKPVVSAQAAPGSDGVLAAFNGLLNGIRHASVAEVTNAYWNSPRLSLFNYNGTVTKGWEQVKKNRESSYPEIKDVKLDVRDVAVTMLGRDAALVSCQWTQTQTYKGTPETASGRMTLVFRRVGTAWKAIHLHSSPDTPNPASVPPSEQIEKPSPTPTPTP
ncbi:MAG TPA: nuclear transport factor 2 family protein [Pyrinomonadaceae bacterium]|nr:nuclear transport factor 2 family protein [Pyrinomonadaceae bacterium]